MPALPEATFLEGVHAAVGQNLEFVPPHAPYGASGSMYIRPLMFASSAQLGLVAGDEFTFLVYVTPTGSLYGTAGGKAPAVDGVVVQNFDRAAEFGTGTAKLAGKCVALSLRRVTPSRRRTLPSSPSPSHSVALFSRRLCRLSFAPTDRLSPSHSYAPVLRHQAAAVAAGYKITLHLDSKTRSFVDEFSTSNFLAIAKPSSPDATPTLVWPQSESILKSVTTMSLVAIAREKGWNIDLRPIPFSDIVEGVFSEVFACGTAAVRPSLSSSYPSPCLSVLSLPFPPPALPRHSPPFRSSISSSVISALT